MYLRQTTGSPMLRSQNQKMSKTQKPEPEVKESEPEVKEIFP